MRARQGHAHAPLLAARVQGEREPVRAQPFEVGAAHVGVLGRAEARDGRGGVAGHGHHRGVVDVQQRMPIRRQRLDELALGARDGVEGPGALEVYRPDVEHDARARVRPRAEQRDLARGVHAVLDHCALGVGPQFEQAERHADLVVVVQLAGPHPESPGKDRGSHELRRRLTHVARDAYHLGGRQGVAPRRSQRLQRGERVVDDEHRGALDARRVARHRAEQHARRAAPDRVGGELRAVGVLAGQADEEVAGSGAPRVDDGAREVRLGAAAFEQPPAEHALCERGGERRRGHGAATCGCGRGTFR